MAADEIAVAELEAWPIMPAKQAALNESQHDVQRRGAADHSALARPHDHQADNVDEIARAAT
jgi:hypothetical protein